MAQCNGLNGSSESWINGQGLHGGLPETLWRTRGTSVGTWRRRCLKHFGLTRGSFAASLSAHDQWVYKGGQSSFHGFGLQRKRSTTKPVAFIVGGTSGIGRGIAIDLARHTKGNCRIIICGRDRDAAQAVFGSFPNTNNGVDAGHEFVQCDVSLMKNVHATSQDLLLRLPKINYLIMSPGYLSLKGRVETEEGIDESLAVHYYARWKFTYDLMPLLRKAKDAGEDAKVLTVLRAGWSGAIDLDDLGLKKHYSFLSSGLTSSTYNDLMIEEFSVRNPDIAFTHTSPGAVRTPILGKAHWTLRALSPILTAFFYPISVSEEVCGEYMLHALLQGDRGHFRRGSKGEDIGTTRLFSSDEAREKLWEHTLAATSSNGD